MDRIWWSAFALVALVAGASVALAQQMEGWLKNPDEGVEAAKKSGRLILVSTCWKPGV